MIAFDWCQEQWRWYINFLEQEIQSLTRKALLIDLEGSASTIDTNQMVAVGSLSEPSSTKRGMVMISRDKDTKNRWRLQPHPAGLSLNSFRSRHIRSESLKSESQESVDTIIEDEDFSFEDLQALQSLEEKVHEAILIIDSNISTLSEAKHFYQETFALEEFSKNLYNDCAGTIKRFEKTVDNIIKDLTREQAKVRCLSSLLTDRKTLVSSERSQNLWSLTNVSYTAF
jgi:hypothetical protein